MLWKFRFTERRRSKSIKHIHSSDKSRLKTNQFGLGVRFASNLEFHLPGLLIFILLG